MPSGFTKNLRSLKKRSFLGQLVVTLLSCELLFFSSFVSLKLPTPTFRNLQKFAHNSQIQLVNQLPPLWEKRVLQNFPVLNEAKQEVRYSSYVPLLPLAVALAYVLGFPLSVFACLLYLCLGVLGVHQHIYLFASGGGFSYWREPGCGYLAGIVAGAWLSSWISADEERRSWKQLLSGGGGVIAAHALGLAYVFGSSIAVLLFEGENAYLQFQPWLSEQIRNLSWYTLPYDLLFATILIALAFPLRWLFAILTSPDISHKHRPPAETQLEVLQETTA